MQLHWRVVLGAALSALFLMPAGLFASPLGTWASIADKGKDKGKVTSHIQVFDAGDGTIRGKVVKLITDPDAKCHANCPGDKANKPVLNMTIMWGFKKTDDNEWKGKIMDPEDGSIYSCIITRDGNSLNVRGYIGVSLLGRTQTWKLVGG